MWYFGTATVTTGSVEVIGDANVDFVNNVFPGDAFISAGNGLSIEILRADSRGKLILARPYSGPSGTFAFSVQPTQDYIRTLALGITDLKNAYGGYRDTILQGMFPDGTVAAPGMRFIADQDTGVARLGDNILALVAGGVARLTADLNGATIRGAYCNTTADEFPQYIVSRSGVGSWRMGGLAAGSNSWALQLNTTPLMAMDFQGNLGVGITAPTSRLDVALPGAGTPRVRLISYGDEPAIDFSRYTGAAGLYYGGRIGMSLDALCFYNAGSAAVGAGAWNERMRLDGAGNLLVGVAAASNHVIARGSAEGDLVMQVQGKAHPGVAFFSAASGSANGSACTFALNKNSQTGRSINAAGTINGSGADYAEYMLKAAGCGIIAKGDVCGVDRDGRLTKTWADAISFAVKSTDPSLVGGDTWAAHLPPRPQAPSAEPVAPIKPGAAPVAPVEPGPEPTEEGPVYVAWLDSRFAFAVAERDYAVDLAEWQAATDAYPAARAAYEADHAAWIAATAAYARDLPAWEAELEEARVCVDRIAFCGQVPCNVSGDFEVGDYIVAAQDGDGIKAVAMQLDDMTMAQYARRIGKVWAIRDGRAWIDVQHG